ncbi:hypothetical protein AB0891_33870 [Streptomyces sp. NPDC007259]|uniref:hypothetical protein n=1 Tax=Streptomyces sp. NPDC007259 TaxID=3154319 RepID=UPI003451DE55
MTETPANWQVSLRVISRGSLHILDALLNLDGGVMPEVVATDNAFYSDIVFGIFTKPRTACSR